MAKFDKYFAVRAFASATFFVAAVILFVTNDYTANNPDEEPHSIPQDSGSTTTITSFDWPGLVLCIIAYSIGCLYNGVVLLVPHGSSKWSLVVIGDMVSNLLLAVGVGVGWEIQTLTNYGYLPGFYYPLCHRVVFFCSKLFWAQIMATTGFVCCFLLSGYTLNVLVEEK